MYGGGAAPGAAADPDGGGALGPEDPAELAGSGGKAPFPDAAPAADPAEPA